MSEQYCTFGMCLEQLLQMFERRRRTCIVDDDNWQAG
jgi:hypothetical protein